MGRVERAAPFPVAMRHQGLECLAEHLRIDRQLDQFGALLTRGETISRKELAEEFPQLLVGEVRLHEPAFGMRPRKQATVQERNLSQLARRRGPARITSVQRAEKQRQQNAAMEVTAALHARVECVSEERAVGVQPAFRLEKGEKEQSGSVENRELPPVVDGSAGQRSAKRLDAQLERAIESARECLAAEDLDPAGMGEYICVRACVGGRKE